MSSNKPNFPVIPENERTPLIDMLLEFLQWQAQRISDLEDEIQDFKKETKKPKFESSKMDEKTEDEGLEDKKMKKKPRRKKKKNLEVHDEKIIQPDNIPKGARFKGYKDIIVQDIVITHHNTRYLLAQYQTEEGKYVTAKLPKGITGHWGSTLRSYILHQYHHQHVTQPLLLEQLHDFEIDISSGQLSHMITENIDAFHDEKDSLLQAGIKHSQYIQTDDTKARHAGKNGYCTHIGNKLFAWFKSTESKSRINFLELLHQGEKKQYIFNAGAFEYMEQHKLPSYVLTQLEAHDFENSDKATLLKWLIEKGINGSVHQRIIIEGAMTGSLLRHGIPTDIAVISDDAGQFNVFDHALCWIHTERLVHRLIPLNDEHKKAVKFIRGSIWAIYKDLKAYKKSPNEQQKKQIKDDFFNLFQTKTSYETLNQLLKRIGKNKHELLRVLDRPELPLHNNLSEGDIRDYVKKRKISGSTRSENGRRCRDTFASLKKTCRKHGISFWKYLIDRTSEENKIYPMTEIIQNATCGL
ncbi:MAG: hypothetical protein ISEC1_P2083 [Thiomicrorhabdus sp.]|nr:MAG: hypothetical protein ISEC1_P2083 [Thiomicrorhabdus sp.]